MNAPFQPARNLKIGQVVELTTLHRATIYRMIERGEFPKNRQISPQRVAWSAEQVDAWIRGEWKTPGGPSGGPDQSKN